MMTIRRALILAMSNLLMMSALSACHTVGYMPPGQVKKVVNPPPGHGGIPPGQLKKY
jgi:hypothetical protein